jgi:hypothetical protein
VVEEATRQARPVSAPAGHESTRGRFLVMLGLPSFALSLSVTTVSGLLPGLIAAQAGPLVAGALVAVEGVFALTVPLVVGPMSDRSGQWLPYLAVVVRGGSLRRGAVSAGWRGSGAQTRRHGRVDEGGSLWAGASAAEPSVRGAYARSSSRAPVHAGWHGRAPWGCSATVLPPDDARFGRESACGRADGQMLPGGNHD